MRIALFTEVFLPKIDGVVTRIVRTLDELSALGHEAIVFAPGSPPPTYAGFEIVKVRSVAFRPFYPEIKIGLPTPRIAKKMVEFRPDVVHALNPAALAAFGVLAAKRNKIPLVASYHTQLESYTQKMHLRLLSGTARRWTSWLHSKADINLCTSPQMVSQVRNLGIRRVDLWPKGVDAKTYCPSAATKKMREKLTDGHVNEPLAIYVGRLSNEKNIDDLLPVAQSMSNVRFAIVGSGPAENRLKSMFSDTNTVFTGYLRGHELASAYASADVFLFPSTTETLGFAGFEAMACGLPVIGANAGGIPDLIDDGKTGFLVPADGIAKTKAIIDRLRRLIYEPELRKQMGEAARAKAEQYSWKNATQTLVGFYEQAIAYHRAIV